MAFRLSSGEYRLITASGLPVDCVMVMPIWETSAGIWAVACP